MFADILYYFLGDVNRVKSKKDASFYACILLRLTFSTF